MIHNGPIATIAVLAALVVGTNVASPATAMQDDPPGPQAAEISALQGFWSAYDVDRNTQRRLVASMRAGELPDSIEPETIPVETETHRSGVFVETIETFEDGSIRVVQVQDLPGAVAHPSDLEDKGTMPLAHRGASVAAGAGSISNCSISSGSGYSNYTNCMVRGSTGQISNWFYADWTIVQGTFNDRITATRNAGQTCTWPYNCSIPSRTQYVQKESVSTTAGVTYRGSWSAVIGSGTTYLNLVVGKNTYSASFTTP